MHHRGFSFIEVMQLCPTYSKATPEKRYEERVYDISNNKDYDRHDKRQAAKVVEDFDHIATGILYENTEEKDFLSLQAHTITRATTPVEDTSTYDISKLLS
jgi:2-oxoglutarate ferredoxin oxidoreductase subunit beta